MRNYLVFLLAALLAGGIIIGIACSKSSEPTEEPTAPDIPAEASMRVCFSTFPTVDDAARYRPMTHCADFDTALALVRRWRKMTKDVLELSRRAFTLARSAPRVHEDDSLWSWTFGVDTNNIKLTARLLPTDSIEWVMIVNNGKLTDFRWYDGHSSRPPTGGWWQYYKPGLPTAGDSNKVLWTGWEKDLGDTTAHFTLINVNVFDTLLYGDSLRYQLDYPISGALLYHVSGPRPGTWDISWHILERWGKIIYPEGREACWDSTLECIDCSSLDWP